MSKSRQQKLDECVKAVYDGFIDPQPHNFYILRQSCIENFSNSLNVSNEEARDLWALFKDRYVRDRPAKNGDLLNVAAIERAKDLGKDVPLSSQTQDEITEFLYDEYMESPSRPEVPRNKVIDELPFSEKEIDLNIYALKLNGVVETTTHIGIGDAGYRTAELTDFARRQLS